MKDVPVEKLDFSKLEKPTIVLAKFPEIAKFIEFLIINKKEIDTKKIIDSVTDCTKYVIKKPLKQREADINKKKTTFKQERIIKTRRQKKLDKFFSYDLISVTYDLFQGNIGMALDNTTKIEDLALKLLCKVLTQDFKYSKKEIDQNIRSSIQNFINITNCFENEKYKSVRSFNNLLFKNQHIDRYKKFCSDAKEGTKCKSITDISGDWVRDLVKSFFDDLIKISKEDNKKKIKKKKHQKTKIKPESFEVLKNRSCIKRQ